jgi:hypothetical protein
MAIRFDHTIGPATDEGATASSEECQHVAGISRALHRSWQVNTILPCREPSSEGANMLTFASPLALFPWHGDEPRRAPQP